jgi:hypothetical protein
MISVIALVSTILIGDGGPAAADAERAQAAYSQSIDDARHGRYLEGSYGLLAHLGLSSAAEIKDPDIFDQWSQVMSCMTATPAFNPAKTAPDYHVPPADLAALGAAEAVPALPAIVARARHTRIVILDENHLDPRGRAFALQVARALRPLGYTTLALEALTRDGDDAASRAKMDRLAADGYARHSNGYYLDDPVFADFLRQSLALGYRPVSYEAVSPADTNAREQEEADNLVRRALRANPRAKLLVYVGEHHAAEGPVVAEGNGVEWMAARLKRLSGIDPLTIDQAGLSAVPMNRPDADLYALAAPKAAKGDVVLMAHGKPLTVGLLGGAVDLQVVHPRDRPVAGRPEWLLGMGRKPVPIPESLLPVRGLRLIQAFVAGEGDDAIPVDQILVKAGDAAPPLMLPSKSIRYRVQDWP